jgi:hypothetical protein
MPDICVQWCSRLSRRSGKKSWVGGILAHGGRWKGHRQGRTAWWWRKELRKHLPSVGHCRVVRSQVTRQRSQGWWCSTSGQNSCEVEQFEDIWLTKKNSGQRRRWIILRNFILSSLGFALSYRGGPSALHRLTSLVHRSPSCCDQVEKTSLFQRHFTRTSFYSSDCLCAFQVTDNFAFCGVPKWLKDLVLPFWHHTIIGG